MKAIIFNSGLGKRMGKLTEHCHKSMVQLLDHQTIFERQLRVLQGCGIHEFVVTTGPFQEQLKEASQKQEFSNSVFHFVENPIYDQTNYIYSMYLARSFFDDECLLLHGDLVFNTGLVKKILDAEQTSLALYNPIKELPEKDFKGRVQNGELKQVSIHIFDEDCFAFQPFYKLSKENAKVWIDAVVRFVEAGKTNVYAEEALNEILPALSIPMLSYQDDFIDECDTEDDLKRVSEAIRWFDFEERKTFCGSDAYENIPSLLERVHAKKPLIVTDGAFDYLPCKPILQRLVPQAVYFKGFSSNPKYEDVVKGVTLCLEEQCDFIISIGGGSAIDVAKCIKLYLPMKRTEPYIEQQHVYSPIRHLAIPTTSGTGSEATRFAVIYYKGKKQSVTDDMLVPDYVILDETCLRTVPGYQKRATVLDALCQGIESYWSIHSNEQSKKYAAQAITLILQHVNGYLENDDEALKQVMTASHLSGKAINITQTTAAHAMSYKITSMIGPAHGHAVATVLPNLWEYMADHMDKCQDPRGEAYLQTCFAEINKLFGCESTKESIQRFRDLMQSMKLQSVFVSSQDELLELSSSVNAERLANNPVGLDEEAIKIIYLNSLSNPEIRLLQKECLVILEMFDRFCKEHHLRYYLGEGSLLGAIRHKGFIPWDDDADVVMERDDFERFLELAKDQLPDGFELDWHNTAVGVHAVSPKIRMVKGSQFERVYNPKKGEVLLAAGTTIDIFPLDNVPKLGDRKQSRQSRMVKLLRKMILYHVSQHKKVERPQLLFLKIAGHILPYKLLCKWHRNMQMKYNNPENEFLVNSGSLYSAARETFYKFTFGEPQYVPFEHLMLPIPQHPDKILYTIYGDYESFPPVETRIGKHGMRRKAEFTKDLYTYKKLND